MGEREFQYRAFLATLVTMVIIIVIVSILAYYEKYAEALGIGGLLTGLVGIATLLARPSSSNSAQADANLATALDKLPPQTTGTGPATPVDEAKGPTP